MSASVGMIFHSQLNGNSTRSCSKPPIRSFPVKISPKQTIQWQLPPFETGLAWNNERLVKQRPTQISDSMDWFKGKFTGKSYIYWENLWFPVDFPLNQSIDWWFTDKSYGRMSQLRVMWHISGSIIEFSVQFPQRVCLNMGDTWWYPHLFFRRQWSWWV